MENKTEKRIVETGGYCIETEVTANVEVSDREIKDYAVLMLKKYRGEYIKNIEIKITDDGFVDIQCNFKNVRFDRIRRITGYLVGTLDRFNDAKREEVSHRVKHSM
ncbi:MAG: anaerobic ribonucleoside-triphosphate reductase [Ruminococcus sp.]|nr:anaerobic ribonucleoside-triphosphate reductase [Ruminococcus sp.]